MIRSLVSFWFLSWIVQGFIKHDLIHVTRLWMNGYWWLTYELHWFHQLRHVADCMTLSVAVMGVAVQFDLVHQIYRIGAAERKPVGRSQPELTGLLLPSHADDIIILLILSAIFQWNLSTKIFFFSLFQFSWTLTLLFTTI